MLLAGPWWYGAVPGVIATGPYNAHFIKDIGAIYLVCAVALAAFAWRPAQAASALAAATGFLVLHAAIHVADALASPTCGADLVRDLPGVFLSALIAAGLLASYLSWMRIGRRDRNPRASTSSA
jgi:hypothetical protein